MGMIINQNGKVSYDGEKTALKITCQGSNAAQLKLLAATADVDVTALAQNLLAVPKGAIILAITGKVLTAITSTTITAAQLDDGENTPIAFHTFTPTTNVIAAGQISAPTVMTIGRQNDSANSIRLLLTGTGTPAGKVRVCVYYFLPTMA